MKRSSNPLHAFKQRDSDTQTRPTVFKQRVLLACIVFLCAASISMGQEAIPSASGLTPSQRDWVLEQGDIIQIGDMIFEKSDLLERGFFGNPWPGGRLYYCFAGSYTDNQKQLVRTSIDRWRRYADVSFIESCSNPARVNVFQGTGCYSRVGMIGGVQEMSLAQNCLDPATIQHEFAHALGVVHEQSRSDRESFVRINWENIAPENNLINWEIYNSLNFLAYDYYSIMHYSSSAGGNGAGRVIDAWPSDRQCTRPPEHPFSPGATELCTDAMGNGLFLTELDAREMAHRYGTTVTVNFRGKSALVSVGGVVCSDDCVVRNASFASVQAINGSAFPVAFNGCIAPPNGQCAVSTQNGHTTVAVVPVGTIRAVAAIISAMPSESIFSNGFE